jgi:hypothetical protein
LEKLIEIRQKLSGKEVYETVANVALIFDITRKIEKVVCVAETLIDLFGEFLDGVFVGYVPDHDGGAGVMQDVVLPDEVDASLFVGLETVAVGVCRIVVRFWVIVDNVLANIDCTCWTFLFGVGN